MNANEGILTPSVDDHSGILESLVEQGTEWKHGGSGIVCEAREWLTNEVMRW